MTDTISFTIPLNHKYLSHTIDYLQNMAVTLEEESTPIPDDAIITAETPPIPVDDTAAYQHVHPEQAFGDVAQAPVQAPAINVDLDSKGLPWDARIHSSGKTKLKGTGAWKPARGIADTPLVDQVEAELHAAMAIPLPTASQTETPHIPPTHAQPVIGQPAPLPTHTSSVVANPSTPPPPAAAIDFPGFMAIVTNAIAEQKVTEQEVAAAYNANGLATLTLVSARPDLIPTILAALGL